MGTIHNRIRNNVLSSGRGSVADRETETPVSWYSNTHAANFNGTSYIRYGNPAKLQLTGDMTVILSMKAFTENPAAIRTVISKWGSLTSNRSWIIGQYNSANTYQIILSTDGGSANVKSYTFPVTYCTMWRRIACTYKSGGTGTLKIYVDGIEVIPTKLTDASVPSLYNSTTDLCVGALYDAASPLYYSGSIDDVKIFNTELSSAQILAEYNLGQGADSTGASGLVFWGKYDNNRADSSSDPATPTTTGSITYTEFASSYYKVTSAVVNKNTVSSTVALGGEFSPQSDIRFVTDSTKLRVLTYNNVYTLNSYWPKVSVWVNGAYLQEITGTANDQAIETEITLSAGTKEIKLINSGMYYSAGVYYGNWVQRIYTNNITFYNDLTSKPEVFVIGDSISNGQSATVHTKDAWLPLTKAEFPNITFRLFGGSALQMYHLASDASTRSATIAAITPGINGKTSKMFILLGTNDYGAGTVNWNAANFQTGYAALLVAINSAFPSLQIYCFTPFYRTTETANSLGSTLDDYRAAIVNACSGKAYATAVDFESVINAGDLADTVHPGNAGHVKINNAIDDYVE